MPRARFIPATPRQVAPNLTQRNATRMLGVMRKSLEPYLLKPLIISYKLEDIIEKTEPDNKIHQMARTAKSAIEYKMKTSKCSDCTRKGAVNALMRLMMDLLDKKDSYTDKLWLEIFPEKPFIKMTSEKYLFRSDQKVIEDKWNQFLGETKE